MGWQDILKSYDLDEFIIKKNKKGSKKKKGEKDFTVDVPGGKLTVTQTARIGQLQADMKKWYETCNNTKLDDIGIVGPKNEHPYLLTQAMVSRVHYAIFNFLFPEYIFNWGCDDWINILYQPKYKFILQILI